MEGLHMPSVEGVKMTLKKHQCQVIKALQHAESNVESMVSNAELPFTSLIKSSVLPSHSSKMKKISPADSKVIIIDQGRRRNFAAKLQEARQRQSTKSLDMHAARQETKKEPVVSPKPKAAAKKVESEPESEENGDDDDDDDLPEVQVMSLDFTEDLFGADKLSKDDIDWVYKEAAASLLLPVSEHRVGQLHDEMRDEILLSECEILRDAFDKDSRNHRRLAQGSIESNNNLLHRLGDTLTSLESKPHFTRDDFPDADGFETWKKQQREKLKSMISTLTQLPDYVGRLHIRVHGARDLPGAEGKVNALCKVQVTKKDKCKTSEVRSLSPAWDEEFKVELTQPFEAVEASVWNKVKLAMDQCFGVALVPYQDLELQLPWEDWFPLLPPDEKKLRSRKQAGGEVNLALHLIHNKRPLMGNNHSYTTGPEWERWERRRARNRDDLPLHYEGYMVLLRTLVQLENPSLASTLSLTHFPVSEQSAWLLEEFAERHLIPPFYTKLAYLSIITKVFEVRKEYLTHVITTLRTLMELQRSDVWFTTTTQERDLFYVTVRDLREEVRQVLLQYHRKLNNFVMWAEEETKKSAQRHISPAQLQKLQVESAVEALTDLLSILLDLLRLIPPIPDKYATASKAGQSSDEVALVSPRKSSTTAAMKSSGNSKGTKAAGPKPTLKQEIAEWIEEGINIRFGKFQARLLRVAEIKLKRRAKAEEEDDEGSGETKEGVIADICDHIVSSLNKDERYYQQPFLKLGGVDVVERALFLYYPHIKVAVTEWLQGGTEDPPLTDRTFDVYFALRKLHQLMSQYDRQEKQQLLDIDKLFLPFVDKYLTQCREKLKEWSQTAFKNDDWMPIDSEEEDDELRILHSASVISLFSAMRQAVQFLLLLNLNLFPSLLHFTKTVGEVVDYYLSKLEKSVASTVIIPAALPDDDAQKDEKVDKRKSEIAKRSSKRQNNNKLGKVAAALRTKPAGFDAEDVSKLPTTVNQELCIKINNVETIVKQLAGLMKDLHAKLTTKEDKAELARIFGGIFSAVELRYNQIIAIITSHMNDSIKQVIYYLLEGGASEEKRIKEIEKQERKDRKDSKDKSQALLVSQPSEQLLSLAEERVEYFFQYLNSEVGVLSDHLYFDAFSILLAHVWTVIVKDFEELLLPVSAETDRYGPRNRPRIAKMLEYIVTQLLFEFFEADGDGLEREYLESTTVLLRRAIALYELETSVLKSIYRGIEKKHETEQTKDDLKADPLEEWHVLCILTARPGDKEAQEFVTAKRASARNQTIRRFFKLSKNDQLIAEFECNNADKIRGRLYLSTSSLCFEPLVDARKLIISIQQITFVARNKHVSFPDAIQITADKEDYAFWSFASNRSEECYEMLIAQARLLGNTAIVPYEEISAADDVSRIQIAHHPISPRNIVSPRRRERTKTITNSKHQSEKEEELLSLFNLPDDETLMQQYGCVLKSKASSGPGRLLIFRSHFCFLPSVGSSLVNVPAAEVKSVTKKRTAILLPNALSVTTRAGAKYAFHSLLKRNEAYSIMREQMEQATEETRQRGGKTKKK